MALNVSTAYWDRRNSVISGSDSPRDPRRSSCHGDKYAMSALLIRSAPARGSSRSLHATVAVTRIRTAGLAHMGGLLAEAEHILDRGLEL